MAGAHLIRHRQFSNALVLVVAGTIAPDLEADEPPWELAWQAPETCPTEEEVRSAVAKLLEHTTAARRRVRARAVVHPPANADESWRVTLHTETDEAHGERELDGPSCNALAEAVALIVALTVDPTASPLVTDPAPAPEADPTLQPLLLPTPPLLRATPAPRPQPPFVPPVPTITATRPELVVGGRIEASIGVLPETGLHFGPSVGLYFRRVQLELSVGYWPPQTATLAERPSAGSDFAMVSGELAARYMFGLGDFELGPGVALQLGYIRAEGFGVTAPGEASGLWLCPAADAVAAWRFVRFAALRLGVGVGFPIIRDSYVIEPLGEVHRASAVMGRAWLGLEARL